MDFWVKPAKIGVYNNGEKLLLRDEHFYSSNISKIYRATSDTEFIVVTEHSVFIVDAGIKAVRLISPPNIELNTLSEDQIVVTEAYIVSPLAEAKVVHDHDDPIIVFKDVWAKNLK